MFGPKFVIRTATLGALGLTSLLSACHYVKQDQMQAELAKVRQEMHSGDQALSGRIDGVSSRVDSLNTALQQMQSDFNTKIQQLQGQLTFDVPVHFDFAKASVREQDMPVLQKFASIVRSYYPNAVVTVEGFTDPSGSRAYNLRLGRERADSVKQFLTTQGQLPASQVRTVSYGEARDRQVEPGAEGPGATGLVNRRVALVIDYNGASPAPTVTH